MITGLAHINLTVPEGTLPEANTFYGETLGLSAREVPQLQKGSLAWFDIGTSGQQVHIAFGAAPNDPKAKRHPCFKLASGEALLALRRKIWEHHVRGDGAAPLEADEPGQEASGAKGVEYPQRFFARDYAGNRLEFSL